MRPALLAGLAVAALSVSCSRSGPATNGTGAPSDIGALRAKIEACSGRPDAAADPACLAAAKADGAAESRRALAYRPPASRLKNANSL